MPRPLITMPTREEFVAAWFDVTFTTSAIAKRYGVSESLVKSWGGRFGLPHRPHSTGKRRGKAPPVVIMSWDDHCRPVNDGPTKGDPTPDEIAERAAAIRAAHIEYKRTLPA